MLSGIIICPVLPPAFAALKSRQGRGMLGGAGGSLPPFCPRKPLPPRHLKPDGKRKTGDGVGGIPVNPQKVERRKKMCVIL